MPEDKPVTSLLITIHIAVDQADYLRRTLGNIRVVDLPEGKGPELRALIALQSALNAIHLGQKHDLVKNGTAGDHITLAGVS